MAETAAKVEAAVQNGQSVEPLLDVMAASLHTTVQAIRSALPSEKVSDDGASATADPASVVAPLSRLKKLLANDDGEAADFILDAQPELAKALTGAEIATLSSCVGNFDFSGALKCVSDIAARLAIQLE